MKDKTIIKLIIVGIIVALAMGAVYSAVSTSTVGNLLVQGNMTINSTGQIGSGAGASIYENGSHLIFT